MSTFFFGEYKSVDTYAFDALCVFRLLGLFDCLDADDMDVYLDTLGSVLDLGGAKEVFVHAIV